MDEILKKIDEAIEFNNKIRPHLPNINIGLHQAKDIVIAEQRTSGWIPVLERLPEKDGYYLVSCNGGDVHTDFFWCDNGNGNSHNNTWLNKYRYEILAWQPLPEPFNRV